MAAKLRDLARRVATLEDGNVGVHGDDRVMRRILFLLVWTLVGACAAEDGRFEIDFSWGSISPPEPSSVDVYGTLFRRGSRIEANDGIGVPYAPDLKLEFSEVVYDRGLVVEVRMVEPGAGADAPVVYFGRSAPFDFEAGQTITVPVEFNLTRGPRFVAVGTSTAALRIRGERNGRVTDPAVTIELVAVGAERLEIAQDIDFVVGRTEIDPEPFGEPAPSGTGTLYRVPYDLNDTRGDCSSEPGEPSPLRCEGPRLLTVRLSGGGFVSPVRDARTILDTRPPMVASNVTYEPASDNVLERVQVAKEGTRITVTLVADEQIELPDSFVAGVGESSLVFARTAVNDFGGRYEVTVEPGLIDGVYIPALTLSDLAGNPTTLTAFDDPIRVDVTAHPLLVDQTRVSYIRSPVGNPDAETLVEPDGTPGHTISAGIELFALAPADGLDPASTLPAGTFLLADGSTPTRLRIWAEPTRRTLLGTARPDAAGAWPRTGLRLVNLDAPQVYVTGVDAAGNESPPTSIVNNWYVASSARSALSPHQVTRAPRATGPLVEREVAGDAALADAEVAWMNRTAAAPSARYNAPMAYDSGRGRVVLFGGFDGNGPLNDTWEWDGQSWTQIATALPNTPTARDFHAMAYDAARARVILFGGFDGAGPLNDTWEWDGRAWTRVVAASSPPARFQHALAYDSARSRVVLFGGAADTGPSGLEDTWEFDGSEWSQRSSSDGPTPRSRHAMAYDLTGQRVILFGGWDGTEPLSDTWAWNGSDWAQVATSVFVPPRADHAMAFDVANARVVLFGGQSGAAARDDTWLFDGSNWSPASTSPRPSARERHAAAYDSTRGQVVVFGGIDATNETWEWDGQTWRRTASGQATPMARQRHRMVYDPARRQVVLFGGGGDQNARLRDTWLWNGFGWRQVLTEPDETPSAWTGHEMAYHPSTQQVVLFGGVDENVNQLNETWLWDGERWRSASVPPSSTPPARTQAAMALDRSSGDIVVFGGSTSTGQINDTWRWTGTAWEQVQTAPGNTPSARSGAALGYDGERIVLFGGRNGADRLDDTWALDDSGWLPIGLTGDRPSPRSDHALAYDSTRGRLLLFGGVSETFRLDDTWVWNRTEWVRQPTPLNGTPPARILHDLAYDSVRDELVLFGGNTRSEARDTWVLVAPGRPSLQLEVALPPDIERDRAAGLQVRGACGAQHDAVDGVALFGWVTRPSPSFELLDTQQVGLPPPPEVDVVSYRTVDAQTARRFLIGIARDLRVYFQCKPTGDSLVGESQVGLRYLETRLHYLSRTQ